MSFADDVDVPTVVLGGLVVVLLITFFVAATTTSTAFGAYNRAWDGSTALKASAADVGAEATVLTNTSRYNTVPPAGSVAVILSPDEPYSESDVARIEGFVRQGGTLVVAEDYGPHANGVLAGVGAAAQLDGRVLRDDRYHRRSSALPVARNVSNNPIGEDFRQLTLNHGTVISPNGADVVVRSSEFGYIDANGNAEIDDSETLGSYPVVTIERVGAGRVIVLADPSVMINVMLEEPHNQAFVHDLFDDYERVLLDYSHTGRIPVLVQIITILRESPMIIIAVGAAIVGLLARLDRVIGVALEGTGIDSTNTNEMTIGESHNHVIAHLARSHPDWEPSRIRRVVNKVIRTHSKNRDND